MSSPSAPATICIQASVGAHPYESVEGALNQGICLTQNQGQMQGSEQNAMEMTEIEYAHIQCLLQAHLEKQGGPDGRFRPAAVFSLRQTPQVIDLSMPSVDENVLVPGENTLVSHGEVPGLVLVRFGGQNGMSGSPSSGRRLTPRPSAVRVCSVSNTDPTVSPTGHGFPPAFQQTADGQEAVLYLQEQSSAKTDRDDHSETIRLYPQNQQHHPKSHSLLQENIVPDKYRAAKKSEATPAASGKRAHSACHRRDAADSQTSQPCMSLSQRKERHNRREQERRKSIRFFCDALNLLVPFCSPDTDKLTTLRLTTAFLTYIYNKYGDTLKEEFQRAHNTVVAPPRSRPAAAPPAGPRSPERRRRRGSRSQKNADVVPPFTP